MNISMKLVYQYMAILIIFSLTSNQLHPLQVRNSRLVVDEDDNGKLRLERVNHFSAWTDFRWQNMTSKVDPAL